MSQENVEVVWRIAEAWSAGNLEASLAALNPEIAWYDAPQQPGGSVRRGHSGVRESVRMWVGAWDAYRYQPEEVIDSGDKVLLVGRQLGRGKGSAVEVASELLHVWTLRDGKAVEMRMFMDRSEAFEAAGLRE